MKIKINQKRVSNACSKIAHASKGLKLLENDSSARSFEDIVNKRLKYHDDIHKALRKIRIECL